MTVGDTRISVSLATVEIAPSDAGARLVYTEQVAFLEGKDDTKNRERGCRELFERLGEELRAHE